MTTAFGSICFGSILVAIMQTLKVLALHLHQLHQHTVINRSSSAVDPVMLISSVSFAQCLWLFRQAAVHTVRAELSRHSNAIWQRFFVCCVDCVLGSLVNSLKFFNKFGFVLVAVRCVCCGCEL